MPRPARKPKKFKQSEKTGQKQSVTIPVTSTPLSTKPANDGLVSPAPAALSAIQPEEEIAIYQDPENDSDEFGFHTVKGIKKQIATIYDSDNDESVIAQPTDSYPADDEEEDIYGTQELQADGQSVDNIASSPPQVVRPPSPKAVKKLRTSELLPLLPSRRKRHQPPRQRKNLMPKLDTSDLDSDNDIPEKAKVMKKRRLPVADKENNAPDDVEVEEDLEVEERRRVVKAKFAEVDDWDLAFETVDLSFSSQG